MSAAQKRKPKAMDRRRFLQDAARVAAGCAVAGMALTKFATDARALPAQAIRPPRSPSGRRLPCRLHPVRPLRAGLPPL